MNQFLQDIAAFAMGTSVWVYVFIFFGKIVEVALGTLRMVLINRGIRVVGSLIAFVEITIWLLVASSVLAGFREDFWKGVVYAVAFASGTYLGSRLDDLLAFGLCSIQVIVPTQLMANLVSEGLRAKGFGITSVDVHGRSDAHFMLLMSMKRKRTNEAIRFIEQICPDAVISVTDLKTQRGGYLHDRVHAGPLRIGK